MRSVCVFFIVVATLFSLPVVAEAKPFRLGFISILSGAYSDVGQGMANAAKLAVEDYEKKHPDEKIAFLLEDDGADPKKALSAYQKLKDVDNADIIMPISTFSIGVLRERLNREKKLTFILGNEPYEPQDDYIYMFSPAAIPAERELGRIVRTDRPRGHVVILASQNEAFMRFAKAVREGAGQDAEILEIPSEADFRALALRIKAKHPAALVFNSFPLDTAKLLKELRRIDVSAALYFDENIANSLSEFQTVLQDLSIISGGKILQLKSEMEPTFVERYQQRFGAPPTLWVDYAYDATCLALDLKDKPVEEARRWLATVRYKGVSGTIQFDNTGLRIAEASVVPIEEHQNFKGKMR